MRPTRESTEASPFARRLAAFAAVLLLGSGGLVACGDDDDGDQAPPSTTADDSLQEGDVSGNDAPDAPGTNPPASSPDGGDSTGEQIDE